MKTIFITLTCLLLSATTLWAQHASFVSSGTIEYDKSSNMNALYKRMYTGDDSFYKTLVEQLKKTQGQFKVVQSTLTFADNKTLFKPIVPLIPTSGLNVPMAEQFNTVYTDLSAHNNTIEKNMLNETFVIKDSVRKIVWHITDQTRDIAGYSCRRANGLMLDSIYVVAFYTDKIAISGGPESFGGLPGMILEVALPHENVTWVATKVTEAQLPAPTITPNKKSKILTNKEFSNTIKTFLKDRYDGDKERNFAMLSYLL